MSYYVNLDDDGNLQFYPVAEVSYPNGIPSTCIEITKNQWIDSYSTPRKYTIENAQLVLAPPPPDEFQFENAQNQKIIEIENDYVQTISAGFQFTIGTSTYTMGWRQDAVYNDQLHLSMTQMAIDKGAEQFPIDYADINGNVVVLPDQTTLTALDSKASAFSWNNLKQLRSTIANIKSHNLTDYVTLQDALDTINAIVWTPATY